MTTAKLKNNTNLSDPTPRGLVSVIVPVYNVLPYIREALGSLINQSYSHLEILLIDDGSTDGSGEVCDEYRSDPRVQVIHQENKGLSGARNTGLDRMHGEYVAFLDPDDAFHPQMIEMLRNALYDTEAEIATCSYANCMTDGKLGENSAEELILPDACLTAAQVLNRMIAGSYSHSVWDKLYKSTLWKDIRFPEGFVYEDVRTSFRIIEKASFIRTIPNCLYYHRIRPGSITQTISMKNMRDHTLAYSIEQDYVESHTPAVFSEESRRKFHDNRWRREELYCAEVKGQLSAGEKTFWKEWRAEILDGRRKAGFPRDLKSIVTHILFLLCPQLLTPVRKIFRSCRYGLRKVVRK